MNDRVQSSRSPRHVLLATLLVAASLPAVAATKLTVGEEGTVNASTMNYSGTTVSVGIANGYLLCANTAWAGGGSGAPGALQLRPQNGSFVFGKPDLGDVRSFSYQFQGDALVDVNRTSNAGTLGCFIAGADGNRNPPGYSGLFRDGFESPLAPPRGCSTSSIDSCVSVSVRSISSAFGRAVYSYDINYQLPAGTTSNYRLRDGYASSVLDTILTSCVPSTACSEASPTVDVLIPPGSTSGVINVQRLGVTGLTEAALRAVTTPVVIAGLFPDAPGMRRETFLSDNVAVGTGAISDAHPAFVTTPTQFNASKGVGMGAGAVPAGSFQISDDTAETGAAPLRATAKVRFGALAGSSAPTLGDLPNAAVSVNCGTGVLPGQHTRTCSISFVPPAGFDNFATTTNGAGVPAYITLTAIDTLGQTTTSAPIPLVVTSTVNSAPSYESSPKVIDSGNGPTLSLTCSLSQMTLPPASRPAACGTNGVVTLTDFLSSVRPGALDSLDENILQTVEVVVSGGTGAGGNLVSCDNLAIFQPTGPLLQPGPPRIASVAAGAYSLNYVFNGTAGVSMCDVLIRDNLVTGSFPAQPDPQQQRTTMFRLRLEFINN